MELKYSEDLGYFVTEDKSDRPTVDLGSVREDAEREFALRFHLDDWITPMVVHNDRIDVNPHKKSDGISPETAIAEVAFVRAALAKVKRYQPNGWTPELSGPDFHLMSLEELTSVGYQTLTVCLKRDCPVEFNDGIHRLVNLVYTLTEREGNYERERDYIQTVREAWTGIPVDRRTWYAASDYEYRVMTDSEADEAWDEDLDNYIDNCLEIPEHLEAYFDRERWKKDAQSDGRGQALSSYNGTEYEVDHPDLSEAYYIYRQN